MFKSLLDKNNLTLLFSAVIVLGFFLAGIFDVLDYVIIEALLFIGFGLLACYMVWMVIQNYEDNKNHPK